MTVSYPSSVKSFTTKVDFVDDVTAAHVNDIQNEVTAIETELGTNPSGSNTTVSERIAAFSSLPGATANLVTISGVSVGIGKVPTKGILEISGSGDLWGTYGWKRQIELEDSSVIKWPLNTGYAWGIGSAVGNLYFGKSTADDNGTATAYPMTIIGSTGDIDLGDGDFYSVAWTDYSATSTVTGWSSYTTKLIKYKKIGKLVFIQWYISGTSDNATTNFTLPFQAASTEISQNVVIRTIDNGTSVIGLAIIGSNSTQMDFLKDIAGNPFTASGTKFIVGQLWYEATA